MCDPEKIAGRAEVRGAETETDQVAWDGNSYSGFNTTTLNFYPVPPATTPTVIVLSGTATATRIEP